MRNSWIECGLVVALVACNGTGSVAIDEGTSGGTAPSLPDGGSGGAGGGAGGGGTPGTTPEVPSFQDDIVPLFYRSCGAGENACHSVVAYGANANEGCRGWLSLEDLPLGSTLPTGEPTGCDDRELYARLTELTAWQCYINGWPGNGNVGFDIAYVTPGSLEDSYIWQKITGGLLCDLAAGEPSQTMPLTAALPEEDLALLEAWILAGAPVQDAPVTAPEDNDTPSCTIQAPTSGVAVGYLDEVALVATTSDPDGDAPTGGSITWSSDLVGSLGTGSSLVVTLDEPGVHVITCAATDAFGATGSDTVEVEAVSPDVALWHPGDGEVRDASNGSFPFIAEALDFEEGDVAGTVVWESDRDGIFGYGREVSYLPSVGTHVITATATDGVGNTGVDSITIEVVP